MFQPWGNEQGEVDSELAHMRCKKGMKKNENTIKSHVVCTLFYSLDFAL